MSASEAWPRPAASGSWCASVVTAFELDAFALGDVVFSTMAFESDPGLLERYGQVIEAAPRELTSFLSLVTRQRAGPSVAQLYSVIAGNDAAAAVEALTPLLNIGTPASAQALFELLHSGVAPMMQFRPIRGAVHDVILRPPRSPTAHRSSLPAPSGRT